MRRSTGTVKRGQWDKAEVWRAFVWRTIGVLLLFTALLKAWQPSSLEPAMSFIGLADTAKVAAIGAIVAAEVTIGYGLLVFGGTCLAGMAAVLLGVFSVALFGFVLSKEPRPAVAWVLSASSSPTVPRRFSGWAGTSCSWVPWSGPSALRSRSSRNSLRVRQRFQRLPAEGSG